MNIRFRDIPPPSKARLLLRELKAAVRGPEIPIWPTAAYPTVEFTYWIPHSGVNFGDELSRTIVQLMLARHGFTVQDETRAPRQMLAIGSILQFARDNAVVWGSGVNGNQPEWAHRFKTLDVRAVRGPYTRHYLMSKGIAVPEIYGDPGLLTPLLTGDRFKPDGSVEVAFVPNTHDYLEHAGSSPIPVIDPRRSWNAVIADIVRCKSVVASSLHGLVLAEAYGIPARYVRVSEREGIVKYDDYYAGTGRDRYDMARSIPEALEMGGAALPKLNLEPLLGAFPYDVWE